MNISGLWKYDELKKQYNAVTAELDAVKKTATQLTNENNDLKRELDMLGDEYQEYRRRAFEELGIKNIKVNMELNKAEARIKELEAKVSQPKWGYHEMMTTDGIRCGLDTDRRNGISDTIENAGNVPTVL